MNIYTSIGVSIGCLLSAPVSLCMDNLGERIYVERRAFEEQERRELIFKEAVEDGRIDHVTQFISYIDVNKRIKESGIARGMTYLHVASERGYGEIVEKLLHAKADMEARNNLGFTPLHTASYYGRVDVVRLYLELGTAQKCLETMLRREDSKGNTPLHLVAHEALARLLIQAKADLEAKNYRECTPLFTAVLHKKRDNVVAAFLHTKADANAKNSDGYTPLHAASQKGHSVRVIDLLLDAKADIYAQGHDGCTALHAASEYGHHDIVARLLRAVEDAQADKNGSVSRVQFVNMVSKERVAPLHVAAERGHGVVVALLLQAQADVNACCFFKLKTPLARAICGDFSHVVQQLLDAKADPALCNKRAEAYIQSLANQARHQQDRHQEEHKWGADRKEKFVLVKKPEKAAGENIVDDRSWCWLQ